MHWLLVVIVASAAVKTDLVFNTFAGCMQAEQRMRRQWSDAINNVLQAKLSPREHQSS